VFRDHFSGHAADYGRFRPTYPVALFEWLSTLVPQDAHVWDCATGNGQAARALAARFSQVFATDASDEQIAAATANPRVRFSVNPASSSGLDDHSVGLVSIAQALHWIDPAPFHQELRRVITPGGLVAAWCYELFTIDPAVDAPMLALYHDIVGADWPPERRHIETGYQKIDWPWPRLQTPDFEMVAQWEVDRVLGYLRTWSAVRRWRAREQSDPVDLVEAQIRSAWGDAPTRSVRWPLKLLVSRIAG
jgi:SAM-dependent methyltransferase